MKVAAAEANPGSGSGSLASESGWPGWADPQAKARLRDFVRLGRVGHAYLLSGPKGVGKAALARAFAQALCCTTSGREDRSEPCGECRACRNVLRNAHPDVEVFDLETQAALADKTSARGTLSIDTVRRLRGSAALLPLEAGYRVVIVDDAETLLEPAQQALLKTLEEPPQSVCVVLLSDEPEALLSTVRSRCLHIAVRPRPESQIRRALLDRGVDTAVAEEVAALSRGCPAWAIAAAAGEPLRRARRSERERAESWLGSPEYDRLVTAYALGEQFGKRRADVIGVVQAAIQVLRDEMIRAAGRDRERLMEQRPGVGRSSAVGIGAAIAASLRCLEDLEANVRPRLALEAMVLQWPRWVSNPA